MGIKNLNKILTKYAPNSIKKNIPLESLSNNKIAIDLSLYLYRFHTMQGHIFTGLFHQIMTLRKHNIVPVYVFDGKYSKEKTKTVESRKKALNKIKSQLKKMEKELDPKKKEDKKELFKIKNRTFCIKDTDIVFCKELFDYLGIPFIQANCEADIVCAYLSINGHTMGTMTEDFDLLTFGCPILIKDFKKGKVTMYNLDSIIQELQLESHDSFRDLCILCGCDYLDSIPRIGPATAYALIKKYNSIENMLNNVFYKKESEKTKEKKYLYPEEYDYKNVQKIFDSSNKISIKIPELELLEIKKDELLEYLKSKEFTEKKLLSISKRI